MKNVHEFEVTKLKAMINTIHINFWARPSRVKKIIILQTRVTVNSRFTELGTTGIKIYAKEWNQKEQRIKGNSPLAIQYNSTLNIIKSDIMLIFNDFEMKKRKITASKIKAILKGEMKPSYTLIELMGFYNKSHPELRESSKRVYLRKFNKILEMDATLIPEEVDSIAIARLDNYLNVQGFSNAYIYKCKAAVKMVLDFAFSNGKIERNRLQGVKITHKKKYDTKHLTNLELKKLLDYKPAGSYTEQAVDIYLLSCFTGLSFIDIQRFKHHTIKKGYLTGQRRKTGSTFFLPLLPEAIAILDKYKNSPPIVSNSQANRIIKEVLPLAGINKYMKFHSGRKTFANYCMNYLLYSKEATAKMMGQKDIRELDAYANTSEMRVIKETALKEAA